MGSLRMRHAALAAACALVLTACGQGAEPDDQGGAPQGSANLTAPPSSAADPDENKVEPGDQASPGSTSQSLVDQATPVASSVVRDYFTWSYADPSWTAWANRMQGRITEGMEHSLSELFTEDSEGSWQTLVVIPRMESRAQVTSVEASTDFAPRREEIHLMVGVEREVRTDSGQWETQDVGDQEVVVVRQGGRLLVEDLRVDQEQLAEGS